MSEGVRQEAEASIRRAVGERLAAVREMNGMTQGALAGKVYVTQPAVSQWERGHTLPSLSMQHRIADALKVQRSFLFSEVIADQERRMTA
jgi:transcriptional regulator with XRE-family HTH domain